MIFLLLLPVTTDYFLTQKNIPTAGQFWRYINMTIIVTDKELTGSYEDEAKKMRDHGIIIHTVGWGEVSSVSNYQGAFMLRNYT